MTLRLSWPKDGRQVSKLKTKSAAMWNRHNFILSPHHRTSRYEFYLLPVRRPISRSKNLAESTSTATFVFGTHLSPSTGDVFVVARVGADPRICMLAAASFSISGRRRNSPATGL